MKRKPIFLDCFSGDAAMIPRGKRSPETVLAVLGKHPRVSTWDMSELPWLRGCIETLIKRGDLTEDRKEPYPWHRYVVKSAKAGTPPAST